VELDEQTKTTGLAYGFHYSTKVFNIYFICPLRQIGYFQQTVTAYGHVVFIYITGDKDKSFILQQKGDHSIKTT
jgi:hypothetical protein